jgi:uncharacterized damage-inducible protein DinB
MKTLFQYNWQVRDDWFSWCEDVPEDELLKARIGGVGGILKTLFHIVDVEYSWICDLQGKVPNKPEFTEPFEAYASLERVKELSKQFHQEVEPLVSAWTTEMETRTLTDSSPDGEIETFRYGEIMRHVIAHEIHHIGQLSVWARELGRKPITANLIRRGLFD